MDAFAALKVLQSVETLVNIGDLHRLVKVPAGIIDHLRDCCARHSSSCRSRRRSGAGMGAEVDAEVEPMSLIPSFQALRRISGISSSMVALDLMLRRIGLLSTVGLRRLREAVRLLPAFDLRELVDRASMPSIRESQLIASMLSIRRTRPSASMPLIARVDRAARFVTISTTVSISTAIQ